MLLTTRTHAIINQRTVMASKTILVGNLGSDPEKRIMSNGNAVVNVSLATTEYWKDKSGNKQSETEWHRLVIYSPLAEIAESWAHKGSKLFIEGRNKTREWTNKDGVKMYTTEIIVKNLELLDPKKQNSQQNQQGNQQYAPYSPPQQGNEPMHNTPPVQAGDDMLEDDIPF
jgi:single-strand DNA-binding protein